MPHIVWTSAGGGAASVFNPAWHAFTGLPTQLPGAAAWLVALHPDEVTAATSAWEEARATEAQFERELRLRRADGVYRWHHIRCVPVKTPEGSVRWLGSATDIHERKTQEVRFELVVEGAGIGIWFCDLPVTTVTCNATYRQLYGLPAEALVTADVLFRAIHPDDLARANEAVRRAVEDQEPYLLDFRVVIGEGEKAQVRWLQATGRVFYDAHGRPERFDGITRDITAQRQLEESLRRTLIEKDESLRTLEVINATGQSLAAELQLEKLVQGVTDAATRLSKASFGAFFYNVLNEQGQSYMLYTLSGVPRETFDKFPMPRATRVFEPTFKGEGIIRSDDITRDPRYGHNPPYQGMPPGHLPVRSYLAVPVKSRSGEVLGGLFFGHPVPGVFTEREERLVAGLAAQAAVAMDNARLFQRAQEAITSRDTFLSIASHELRTPITSMKMQTQYMRKRIANNDPSAFLPERVTRLVEQTERSIGRLSRLVEDMLDISRIAIGRLNMQFERVELSALTREVVERFGPQLGEAGHTLELHLTPGLVGRWDRDRLEQVLANLLTNALKYAPGAALKVTTRTLGTSAILEVEDRGPGIAPKDQHRIFERFERLVDASQISGLGLGLHISKHIVEAHGGTIRVHSALGEGASFVVELPISGPSGQG
ncbi:PAS domain S-box-containing protein [Archangium gephyra]|uniref:histidine kinase n=3 Tax=Archangium gephyra TaxID=48 RepID=A0ABX9JMX0_9BACT|nr:PAS domain S-box-containing protein [Archangium gephyra]